MIDGVPLDMEQVYDGFFHQDNMSDVSHCMSDQLASEAASLILLKEAHQEEDAQEDSESDAEQADQQAHQEEDAQEESESDAEQAGQQVDQEEEQQPAAPSMTLLEQSQTR